MGSGVAAGYETKNHVRTVLYRIIDRECSCKCKGWRLRWKQGGSFCVLFLQHIIIWVINFPKTERSRYCPGSSKKYPLPNTTVHGNEKKFINTGRKYTGQYSSFTWKMVKINIHFSGQWSKWISTFLFILYLLHFYFVSNIHYFENCSLYRFM